MRPGFVVFLASLLLPTCALATVHIDGHIEPGEWKGARHITDFVQTQPMTGKPATWHTEAWILATPEGLAVAFRNTQPPGVPRTMQQVQRDFDEQVDRNNVEIDFNGDGHVGYNFTVSSTGGIYDAVITQQTRFDDDWDGLWQHAASQDAEGWTSEFLIPWSIAPMHKVTGGKRTIGIYLDRVVGSTGERDSWPNASFQRPRFLSDFKHIDVPAYSQSQFAITPYVSALYDNVRKRSQTREGMDIFWKPNGQFQLTATLNPDFGQVESDDLVVNFGATETYFSDKRPFFTENQGIFDFGLLDDNSALVYTRRVGGPSDDGQGVSDINAAVKLNGSVGTTDYGVLAADERGADGRTFAAARVMHDFGKQSLGVLATRVERPFLDRTANVIGIDHHWQPNNRLTLWTNLVGSDIVQQGDSTRGSGATFIADYTMDDGWRQQWLAMHFDDQLQINDFGYLERNNFDYVHWEVRKRITDLPTDSRYSSHDWQFRIDALDNDDEHLRLRRQLRIGRSSQLRNGGNEDILLNVNSAGWDDLITRGHGALFLPPSMQWSYEYETPRQGHWSFDSEADIMTDGLSGNRELGWAVSFVPTYFISDALRVHAGLTYQHVPDWLVWQHDNLIGRFDQHQIQLDAGFDWSIDARQELRLKLQAIGLNATSRGGYLVNANGRAVATDQPVDDFSVRNLGIQLRYRYKLAPLSWLYVVYGRGGYVEEPMARNSTDLLSRALGLRQDEQLLVKFSYRFGL
ncbi:MAG TPA: DUF5916 domain-containing protein [Oleiagrimonas sp.]|nr:DUF5916 domain-containing protein [Oleiagrimonas sp.]